jgi:hypothetical protein
VSIAQEVPGTCSNEVRKKRYTSFKKNADDEKSSIVIGGIIFVFFPSK